MKKRQNRKNTVQTAKAYIHEEIRHIGAPILQSEVFHRAASETHHLHGTVSDHTLTVCMVSMQLARLLSKAGISVNQKDLIEASLGHDLGMVGRGEKYKNRTAAWKAHPVESVKICKELIPGLSENAESMILSHMWPITGPRPRSREALLLNAADKAGSLVDWWKYLSKHLKSK